jgi:hypothetical protein
VHRKEISMRRRRTTFVQLLSRSVAAFCVAYALAAAYLVSTAAFAGPSFPGQERAEGSGSPWTHHPEWRPRYAVRFPGCVDIGEWTRTEAPTAVVVVRRSSDVVRMDFDDAFERSRTASRADDVWTVGACA